ncbi:MAG: Na+/H+ antiporter subunit G [Steroidobacteraceae bacterium]|nr:Na+/H+ antiporter subunit G [Steroidobacteraceae bacterium]
MLVTIAEVLIAALLLVGSGFALVGSYGLAKLGDFYLRLHGPAKATTMGVGSALVASSLYFTVFDEGISVHEVLVAAFLFMSAPVSVHMLVKAVLKNEHDRKRMPPSRPDA